MNKEILMAVIKAACYAIAIAGAILLICEIVQGVVVQLACL